MKKLSLLFFLVAVYFTCKAQSIHQLNKDTLKCKTNPLIEVNNAGEKIIVGYESTTFIDVNNINSINVYKKAPISANEYESEAKNGVILIELKSKVDFITLNKLF